MAKVLSHGYRHIEEVTDPSAPNSAGNTDYNNLYPRFATASNGDIYAVWQQCGWGDLCPRLSVFVNKYDATNQTWGTALEVATTAALSSVAERPDIALDSNDLAHIVWTDDGEIGSRYDDVGADIIYCTWNGVNAAGLSSASTVSEGLSITSYVYESRITIVNDVPYVVYRGDGESRLSEIYLSYPDSSGWVTSQVSDNTLDQEQGAFWSSGSALAPAIAGDNNNNLHITWYNSDSSYTKIHYRKFVSSTSEYGPISALSVCGPTVESTDLTPTIAVSDACKVYISWVGLKDCADTTLGYSIYYSTIDQDLNFITPVEITHSSNFDNKLVFDPQIITRPGIIGTDFDSKDASFAIVWKSDADINNSDFDNDILIQRFNDCEVEVGNTEVLSSEFFIGAGEGEGEGAGEGDFDEGGDSSEPAVTTSDSEIFVGWQEKPTGNNEVYNIVGTRIAWGTDGASGSCNSTYYDYCADCIENTTEDQTCGLNNRGVETRTCTDGGWGPWGACNDPDVCVDDTTSSQACGLNNRGTQSRTCTTGQWSDWGTCNDPDECVDDAIENQNCGLNNRGVQSRLCTDGVWGDWGIGEGEGEGSGEGEDCTDPDECVDGAQETQICGLNNRGLKTRTCTIGQWPSWENTACIDPDECIDGAVDSDVCGFNNNAIKHRTCVVGSWDAWGVCPDPDECALGSERIISCGTDLLGTQLQICQLDSVDDTYQWNNFGACVESTGPTGPTEISQATDVEHLLPPTYGSLGVIYIDKPLGAERSVCFDEKATRIEVVPQIVFGEVGNSIVYDMSGNIASRNNDLKHLSETVIYESIDQALSPPVWQTGPCLTSCTDEVPIGYSNYYFNVEPYDNNTFDVEYCLTDGEIDTFVLTVTITDFKTSVVEIDKEFGTAIENGWDIKFRSLANGFTVVYGHGTTPIKPAGLSTLIRVYLDNSIIEQNPENITDAIIVFPVFMKLGNTSYKIFDKYISEIDTVPFMNLIDSAKSSTKLPANHYPWSQYIADSSILPYTYTPAAILNVNKDWQLGSGFLADLQNLGTIIDPRFKEVFHYVTDSFERIIKDYPNDAEYEATRNNSIEVVHYFKTSIITWASFMRVFPIADEYFDFTWDQWHGAIQDHLCIQNFTTRLFCKESVEGGGRDQIEIVIYYTFPMMSAAGIEIDFSNFAAWMEAYPTTSIVEAESWTGGLKEKNFLQAYSKLTSKFAAVYGAKVSSGSKSDDNPYLVQKGGHPNQSFREEVLTKIIIDVSDSAFDAMFADASEDLNSETLNCAHLTDSDGFEIGGYSANSQTAHPIWLEITEAINKDLLTARVVTNQNVLTRPSSNEWTGNAYSVGSGDVIDVKDYLTVLMISVEGESVDLTSKHIEETIKLPYSAIVEGTESTYKTVQEYYNLSTLDLSGISYKTVADATCDCPWVDSVSGEHMLATIDANNDGVIDIYDVVAIRNLWSALDQYPLDVEVRKLNIIPSNLCVPFDISVDLLMPDECSNFRVKPKCFSKVWLSDVISIKDEENPVKYLLEVSYSIDALDINDNPIEDFSGVQFRIEGLSGDGIIGTENGTGTNVGVDATAVKALQWSENILPSVADSFTKDTYFAFSTNGKYISKGKDVLCYISIRPESLPDSLEWMDVDSVQDFIVTNKFKRFKTVEGVRISHPLANLKFKSHHTDELLIYESIGLKISDFKITTSRSFNNTTGVYSNILKEATSTWTGDTNNDSVVTSVDLNYALGLAARKEYDINFDSNGSGIIDIVDIQAVNHLVNDEIFNFGTNIVSSYCCLCTEPQPPALTVIDFSSENREISIVGQRITREITLSGEEFSCHSTKRHTGGIGIYWNPIDNTDYYIVYRQSAGEPAVAIIGSAPGAREDSSSFDVLTSGGPKTPVQILPTLWIDYPPVISNACENYITGTEELDCDTLFCDIVLSDTYCVDLTCPDNYSLLLHLNDDVHKAGAIIDSSQYDIQSTAHNNAYLDSSILKFGNSSCAFDGIDDYISINATSTELELDGDFTIDFWARFQDTSGNEVPLSSPIVLFSSFDPTDSISGGDQGLSLESYDGQGTYYIRNKEGDTYDSIYIPQTAASTLNTTDWFHFAVVRYNDVITLYVNGVKSTSSIANNYIFNHSQYGVFYIGKSLSLGNHFEGNIDEFRIVKGEALWTDDFSTVSGTSTVPTKETVCSCKVGSESEIISTAAVIAAQAIEPVVVDPNIHIAEEFEYWVVAVNKCGEVPSSKETGSTINCRFGPVTEDFLIEVEMNQEYSGEFKVSYEFAARPLGNCIEASGDCIPLWTYVQNSNTGTGKKGISDEGGLITTTSRMPSTTTLSGKDEILFTYKPKENFVGKDTFKYTATILDPNSKENPAGWCKTESTITVYVKPPSPSVTYSVGECQSDDEGKATLSWVAIDGAESYKVFKGGVLKTTISSTGEDSYSFEESVSEWDTWIGHGAGGGAASANTTSSNMNHTHEYIVDNNGYGWALETTHGESTHAHEILNWVVQSNHEHSHSITTAPIGNEGCANDTNLDVEYSVSSYYTVDGNIIEGPQTSIQVSMPCCVNIQGPNLEISLTQKEVQVAPSGGALECPPDNYAILLHFDEDNQSGNPIDSGANTISCTYSGGAALSADSPNHFSVDSSVYLDGAGDYVTIAQDSKLILDGDYTIDFWAKFDDVSSDACFFSSMDLIAATTVGFELRYFSSTNMWYFSQNSGDGSGAGFGCGTWTFTPSNNLWYHIALIRNFNTGNTLYINGVRIDHQSFCYGSDKFIYNHNNNGIDIGRSRQSSSTFFKGYIDEFRIVNGAQIWTSDFSSEFELTPPGPYCPDTSTEEGSEETEEISIRETTITWADLEFVDTYKIHRRGPYTTGETPPLWIHIDTITSEPVGGIYTFTNLLNECYGCESVLYDYYITSFDEINGESIIEQNIKQVAVQCITTPPVANDKIYITKYNTNIVGEKLLASTLYSDIVSYSIVTPPDSETGTLYDLDNFSTTGEWSFNPDPNFAGGLTFEWEVLDSCGNTDRGIVTIVIELKSSSEFLILDGNELVEQQNITGVRKVIDGLEMVPGQIGNINSVSALRKRDNAYKLTKTGLTDIVFEEANHGCTNPSMFNYSPLAEVDDGSCIPYIYGCIDTNYQEYDEDSNTLCVDPVCSHPENYSVLIHFNDDGSGEVFDSASYEIPIFANGATLNSSVVKFGNASCLFDGADDYVALAAIANNVPNPALTLSGDFTIDFWSKSNNLLSTQTFIGSHDPTSGNDGYQGLELERFNVGSSETYFWLRAEGSSGQGSLNYQLVVPMAINANDWFHYALIRFNGEIKLYINGVSSTFGVLNTSVFNHASFGILYIGASPKEFPALTNHLDGYVDEFRIINGQALWTSDFSNSLPTSEFSTAGCAHEGCTPCQNLIGCTFSWADNYNEDAVIDDGSCYKYGCTEEWAENYDTEATILDGSCYKYGCTYDWADNFEENATIDNGTCVLAGCTNLYYDNYDANATSDDGSCYKYGCTEDWADNYDTIATINDDSCYKFGCIHEWADNHDENATNDDGTCYKHGCIYSWADNYDPSATINDDSCLLAGCTGTWADNYNGNATSDDGSCYKYGCTSSWADNYDATATISTDTCYKYGCMEDWADNFDEEATILDDSCYKNGCTSDWADNFDISATVDDGSCYLNGCTQTWADNFDPNVTIDNGSCVLAACTDPDSDNFDPNATHDDGSCFICGCMETWAENYNPFANIGQGDNSNGGNCYFQGIFHFDGIDEETINQSGWINSGTDATAYWSEGWGTAKLDTGYSSFGTSSFNSVGGSAILHGSTDLLDWPGAFTIDLRFATIAGANNVGVEAFILGSDKTEPAYAFYVYFEQLSATRQRITVSTALSSGVIVFDSDLTTIEGNMVSMPILDGSNPSNLSVWQHLAVTRNSNSIMRLFIDGVEYGYTIDASGTIENQSIGLDVGGYEQATYATSWIDELRIHNGVDHSITEDGITTFPVPTEEYSDIGTCYRYGCTKSWAENFDPLATRDAGEALFANSGSSDGEQTLDTDISDIYSGSANVGNMPVITSSEKKFGGASIYMDGTGGHVHIHDNPDTDFGTEDFTIDFWVRFDDVTRDYDGLLINRSHEWIDIYSSAFMLYRSTSGGTQTLTWSFTNLESGNTTTSGSAAGTYAFQNDTWYHIAIVKTESGQYLRLYLDGVLLGQTFEGDGALSPANRHYTGRYNTGGLIFGATRSSPTSSGDLWRFLKGYIDEIRISKGENKYPYGDFILETDEYCKNQFEGECVNTDTDLITETSGSSYKLHGFMFNISNESDFAIIIDGTFSILGDNHAAGYTWPGGISVYYIVPSPTATYDINVNLDTGTLGNWILLGTDTNVTSQGDWNSGVFTPIDVQSSFILPAGQKSALYITALDLNDIGGFDCTGESGCLTVGDPYVNDGNLAMFAGISKTYDDASWYPNPAEPNQSRLFRGSVGYQINCIDQCYSAEYILHFNDIPCYLNGCAELWADNYDANVTIDDGSCVKDGCMAWWAENYDTTVTDDDGSCYLNGCTDSNSDNYDPNATIDDDSCYRAGCTSANSDGYDPLATDTTALSGPINSGELEATISFKDGDHSLFPNCKTKAPQIMNVNPKFGHGVASFDGHGGHIHIEVPRDYTSNLYINDGDAFTIDFWARFTGSSTSSGALFGTPNGDGPTRSFRITFDFGATTPHFTVAWTQFPDDNFVGSSSDYYYTYEVPVGTIDSTTWYHIALSRDATTNDLHFFLGGTEITKSGPWTSKTFTANEDGELLYQDQTWGYPFSSRFDTRDTGELELDDIYFGWSIGYDHTVTTQFVGEIDEFRFTSGENHYSSGNFTPETEAYYITPNGICPDNWFVWHFNDDSDGFVGPFADSGPNNVDAYSITTGNTLNSILWSETRPHISVADYSPRAGRPHFGGKALRFDGVEDNIRTGTHSGLAVPEGGDFTLDFWVYFDFKYPQSETGWDHPYHNDLGYNKVQLIGYSSVYSYNNDDGPNISYCGPADPYGGERFEIKAHGNSTSWEYGHTGGSGSGSTSTWSVTGFDPIQNQQWYHIALTRKNNYSYFFVNGVRIERWTPSSPSPSVGQFNSGVYFGYGSTSYNKDDAFRGFLDELRLINGKALWTDDFNIHGLGGLANGQIVCDKKTDIVLHFDKVACYNYGCTDPLAQNYNKEANVDDDSCIPYYGCLDPTYDEYVDAIDFVGNYDLILPFDNNILDLGSGNHTTTTPGVYNGAPTFDANNKKFGSHAIRFDPSDGSGDFIHVEYSDLLKWENDFTVDFWFKFASLPTDHYFFFVSQESQPTSGISGFRIGYYGSTMDCSYTCQRYFQVLMEHDNEEPATAYQFGAYSHSLTDYALTNEFHHLAVVRTSRSGGGIKLYLNGISLSPNGYDGFNSSSEGTGTINYHESNLVIGRLYGSTGQTSSHDFDGWIDQLRITKDRALWTSNFYPDQFAVSSEVVTASCVNGTEGGGCTPCATISGCTDNSKFNYDSNANNDDGSCIDVVYACLDPDYDEYDPRIPGNVESISDDFGSGEDDFQGGSNTVNWQVVDQNTEGSWTSNWYFSSDTLIQANNIHTTYLYRSKISYSDLAEPKIYDVQLDAELYNSDDDNIGLIVRYDSTNNYYYRLRFNLGGSAASDRWTRVERYDENGYTTLAQTASAVGMLEDTWHDVRFTFSGNAFTVLLDGTEILSGTDPNTPLPVGTFGLYSGYSTYTNFKNVVATNLSYNVEVPNTSCVNGTEGGGCTPCTTISGCTDSTQDNYNASANNDDGSCYKYGCTDPTADNYDANATIDFTPVITNSGDGTTAITFNNDVGGNKPIIVSTISKFGNNSLHFDGMGGYINLTNIDLDSGFTIDFWVKLDSLPSHSFEASRVPEEHIYYNKGLLSTTSSSSNNLFVYFADLANYGNAAQVGLVVSSLEVQNYNNTSSGHYIAADVSSTIDTTNWFHVALTRSLTSNMLRLFFNGAFMGSGGIAGDFSLTNGIMVGSYGDTLPAKSFEGQIDEFRYREYTSTYPTDGTGFTVETTPYTSEDIADGGCGANVAVYHFDTDLSDSGTNANTATSYVDPALSGVGGDVSINTDSGAGDPNEGRAAFGNSSLRISPSMEAGTDYESANAYPSNRARASYLDIPYYYSITNFAAYEELTIDFWVRFDDVSGYAPWNDGLSSNSPDTTPRIDILYVSGFFDGYPTISFRPLGDSTSDPSGRQEFTVGTYDFSVPSETPVKNDTWYHLAITRTSSQYSLYLNGKLLGTNPSSYRLDDSNSSIIRIGGPISSSYDDDGYSFSGYVDELRIVKGRAMWTGDFFEVPTSQYTCNESYPTLLHFEDGDPCVIKGCTIIWADNYDENATIDDGSCTLGGCMDSWEDNYNPYATTDDGSCSSETGICADGVVWHFNDAELEGTSAGSVTIINSGTSDLVITAETIGSPATDEDHNFIGANFQLDRTEVGPFGNTFPLGAAHSSGVKEFYGHNYPIGYISIEDSEDLHFSGKFTIDFWYKPYTLIGDTNSENYAFIFGSGSRQHDNYGGNHDHAIAYSGIFIGIDEVSDVAKWKIRLGTGSSYTDVIIADHGLTEDVWSHIALIRAYNDDIMFFVDGALKGGPWPNSAAFDSFQRGWSIGKHYYREEGLNGSIKELRMLKGSDSGWDSNGFTPPTRPYGPPYSDDDAVGELLLHFNAEDFKRTTLFKDSSGNPDLLLDVSHVALSGTTNTEGFPVVSKVDHSTGEDMEDFGLSSIYFPEHVPASTLEPKARIDIPDNSAINIGTDDFTIDFWFKPGGDENIVLMHFDNDLIDSSVSGNHTAIIDGEHNSGPTFDAVEKQFGTHSLKFDLSNGNGDFITIPYSEGLTFEAGFTIDFWFRFTTVAVNGISTTMMYPTYQSSSYHGYFSGSTTEPPGGISISYLGNNWPASDAGGRRTFSVKCPINTGTESRHTTKYKHDLSDTELQDSFHHLAFTRVKRYSTSDTGVDFGMRFYIDGVEMTTTHGTNYFDGSGQLYPGTIINETKHGYTIGRKISSVGILNTQLDADDFEGWIDEFRIINHSHWLEDFTPPVVPHLTHSIIQNNNIIKSLTSRQTGDNASTDNYGTLQITLRDLYAKITVGGDRNANEDAYWEPSNVPNIYADTWYHIALTRTGDVAAGGDNLGEQTLKFYINGTEIDSQTIDDQSTWDTQGYINRVGTVDNGLSLGYTTSKYWTSQTGDATLYNHNPLPSAGLHGYIDELRIIKGEAKTSFGATAEYSCNEPLSNTCPSDWSLYHFDDGTATDGDALTAASLADAGTGSHDATVFGDPKISTTSVMGGFGSSCADLDGNDYLSIPYAALIDGGTDFSIDFWINFDDLSADISILKMFGSNDDEDLHIKYVQSTTEIWCGQDAHTASDGFTETSVNLFTGAWYHFAIVRGTVDAGAIHFYINGKLIASDVAAAAATLPQSALIFGSTLNGFIDEIRIVRNQATIFTKKPVKAYTCNE